MSGENQNRYYAYFRNSVGNGDDNYFEDIGRVYKSYRGLQRGFGIYTRNNIHHNRRGLGFGSTLMSLFRFAKPMLKNFGTKAVNIAADVAKDVIKGENVKNSTIRHLSNEAKTIISKLPEPFSGIIAKPPVKTSEDFSSYATSEANGSRFNRRPLKRKTLNPGVLVTRAKKGRGVTNNYPALKFLQ